MLEHACLIVSAWTRAENASDWIRRVTDNAGAPLGFVQSKGAPTPWWLGWLRRLQLDIYETDDASHLLTLRRAWALSRVWSVLDADEVHVGTLYHRTLVSSARTWIGELRPDSTERGTIIGPRRMTLACYQRRADRSQVVTFAAETMANPFLRMLLLGSILSLEPSG